MALLKRDPDKAEAKAQQAEARAQAAAEAAFWQSPPGQARAARASGQRLFEIAIPISETQRSVMGVLSGDKSMMTRSSSTHTTVLQQIEDEGWRLAHVGYVFEETGSVSRDKFYSSGQTASVTGRIMGIYLFRAFEPVPPTPDK